jgi:hypothetical protein
MTPQSKSNKKHAALLAGTALLSIAFAGFATPSLGSTGLSQQLALSEIKKEEIPAPGATATPPEGADTPAVTVPAPEPITPGAAPAIDDPATQDPGEPGADEPDLNVPQGADPARPNVDPNAPVPAVEYDLSKLPAPVRDLHDKLVAAAKAGLIEAVRPLLKTGEDATQLSLAGVDNDPITFLKSLSGDEGGQEILAILLEVLEAGYVHLDAGKPEELYVWPYFFAVPLDKLTDMQRVELFKLVTSGDYEDMKSFGAYIFYRVGISPDGQWRFFLAGE